MDTTVTNSNNLDVIDKRGQQFRRKSQHWQTFQANVQRLLVCSGPCARSYLSRLVWGLLRDVQVRGGCWITPSILRCFRSLRWKTVELKHGICSSCLWMLQISYSCKVCICACLKLQQAVVELILLHLLQFQIYCDSRRNYDDDKILKRQRLPQD